MRTWSYGFCAWRLLPQVPTVSFVRSEIVRMTCRIKWGDSGSCHSCGPWPFKGLDLLEISVNDTPKDFIGRYGRWSVGNSVRRIWLVKTERWSVWRALIGWIRKMVRRKSSDWSVRLVCLARVIWLDDPISCLLETGSNWTTRWSVFWRLLLTSYFANSCSHSRATRKQYANCVLFMRKKIRRSICRCAQNRKNDCHFCYYLLYPWWIF